MPTDVTLLFEIYAKMYELTDGLMTPLISNALSRAGDDAITPGLQFVPVGKLNEHFDFEAMVLYNDGHYFTPIGWRAELYI